MGQLVDGMHASGNGGAARLVVPVGSMRELAGCCAQIPSRRADAASDAVRHVERDYREAMAELLLTDDVRRVLVG